MTNTNEVTTVNPFFNVVREPAFAELNGQKIEINRDVLLNPETQDVVGVVGKNYSLVQNIDVARFFDEAFSKNRILSTKDHLNTNTGKWIREIVLDDDEYTAEIDSGDTVKAKVQIYNGYDGKTAVGFRVSAYRLVCTNGLMGWKEIHGGNFTHMGGNLVDRIQAQFANNFSNFSKNFGVWEEWTKQGFGQTRFNQFVELHTKSTLPENVKPTKEMKLIEYLSDKQAEAIKDLYVPTMELYKEKENKWGAYNVLTAIGTHHTDARKGSPLFTAGYKRINRLVEDFYDY